MVETVEDIPDSRVHIIEGKNIEIALDLLDEEMIQANVGYAIKSITSEKVVI